MGVVGNDEWVGGVMMSGVGNDEWVGGVIIFQSAASYNYWWPLDNSNMMCVCVIYGTHSYSDSSTDCSHVPLNEPTSGSGLCVCV